MRLFEPGVYSGRWLLGDEKLGGTVDLRAGQRPLCRLLWGAESLEVGDFPRAGGQVEVLRGRLENGYEVILLDGQIGHGFAGRTGVSAAMALAGWEIPDDLLFGMVEFQVGGLSELATVPPLKAVQFSMAPAEGAEFAARWDAESEQRWRSADGDEIELKFTAAIDWSGYYGMTVATSPIMRIRGTPRTVREWLCEYVVPMVELTSMATARRQPVAWVKVGSDAGARSVASVQVFGPMVEAQAAFNATEPELDQMISEVHASLISLGPAGVNLVTLLSRWRELREKHRTFYEYLIMARTDPHASDRARLMTVLPALEALHDRLHGSPSPEPGEKRRNEVLNRIHEMRQYVGGRSGLTNDDMQFLEERLAPSDGILARRLTRLVERNLTSELRAQLTRLIDPLPEALVLDKVTETQTAWAAMGTVRNRLAHGKPLLSARQVAAAARLANTVAVAVALQVLEVPDAALRAGVEHRRWPTL